LSLLAQCTEDTSGLKQRSAQLLGEVAKCLAPLNASSLSDSIEIIGRDEFGMHREGGGLCQTQLIDLLSHITGDKLDGGLHFRHDPLGFFNSFQATLAESFVLSQGANLIDVALDIGGNELAVSAHAVLKIDKVVGMTNTSDTHVDLLALLRETLVLKQLLNNLRRKKLVSFRG